MLPKFEQRKKKQGFAEGKKKGDGSATKFKLISVVFGYVRLPVSANPMEEKLALTSKLTKSTIWFLCTRGGNSEE